MRRKLSLVFLLIAWLCANGVAWNVVQVVGWAQMIHDYSQRMPLADAIERTFDGSAPCGVCKFVDSAEETAKQRLPQDTLLAAGDKFVLACELAGPLVFPVGDFSWPGGVHAAGLTRTEAVPVPPPRV